MQIRYDKNQEACNRRNCETYLFGAFARALSRESLLLLVVSGHKYRGSLASLRDKIRRVQEGITVYSKVPGNASADHALCNPVPEVCLKFEQALDNISLPITDQHESHLNQQAKKTGLGAVI